jgi:phosphatidate phosphatase APP1
MRFIICFFFALSTAAFGAPWVLLFPAIGTPNSVTLSGRVFKHAVTTSSNPLRKNLGALLSSNYENAAVEVRFLGQSAQAVSDADGHFSVEIKALPTAPFAAGNHTAEASVKHARVGRAPVEVMASDAAFFVISDLDDTLAVTDVLHPSRLLRAALLSDAKSQAVVPGMSTWYRCLRHQPTAAPAFALVSGSPEQYAPRIHAFLVRHQFPPFGLYLRDLGPDTLKDYKQPMIRALLNSIPQQVILIGDSGERDPEVYAQMAAEFPGRVKAIYIRDAGRAEDAARFKNMFLFNQASEAALDASQKGLMSEGCFGADAGVEL